MNQQHEAESMFSKYVDNCLEEGPAAMGFLFTKVDRTVLDPAGKFSCFLVDCCLDCCLTESEKNVTFAENGILHSGLLKRILTIAQDFSYPLTAESQLRVIDYIFRSWNSSVEVVCHEAVDIFFTLLSNHCLVCSKCRVRKGCEWSDSLARKLFENESPCRSRYKCLLILFQSYSTYVELISERLVEELYLWISDPGLSVVDRLLPCIAKSKFLKDNFLPQLLDYINALFFKQLNLSMKITSRRYQALVSCIDDPFELCQITALNILKKLPVDESFKLNIYKNETIKMMNSIRSHNTLAAGYRMQVSFSGFSKYPSFICRLTFLVCD
uniref:DNA-dependent protein kinase catalytic subunit n=1 Tax=Angiostrongylus cantonensis TaxID=6313 RepID=A0A158P790_ANGCA